MSEHRTPGDEPAEQMPGALIVLPVRGMPEIAVDDDLGAAVVAAIEATGQRSTQLRLGDIVVVTSKIISKALGLTAVAEDPRARTALVRQESTRVVTERATHHGLTRVVAARSGPVMAGAGIDGSNTGGAQLLLLPHDPDAAARQVREQLIAAGAPTRLGVIVSDTAGRAWRVGLTDLALGLAGVTPLDDLRGAVDADGRDLSVTVRCLADEIAAAADLVKGKVAGVPVAVVRGLSGLVAEPTRDDGDGARALVRSGPQDWFALGRAEAVRAALGIEPGSATSEQVGIASVHPESVPERTARALRAALSDPLCEPVGADLDPQPQDVVRLDLTGPDLELGRAWGRLDVALAGEDLRSDVVARPAGAVHLTISAADASAGSSEDRAAAPQNP